MSTNAATARRLTVEAPGAVSLRLPVFGFPAWQATLDDMVVDWRLDPAIGAIPVDVPAGQHAVALRYVRLPVEVAGPWVSAEALAVLLALLVLAPRRCVAPGRRAGAAGSVEAGLKRSQTKKAAGSLRRPFALQDQALQD